MITPSSRGADSAMSLVDATLPDDVDNGITITVAPRGDNQQANPFTQREGNIHEDELISVLAQEGLIVPLEAIEEALGNLRFQGRIAPAVEGQPILTCADAGEIYEYLCSDSRPTSQVADRKISLSTTATLKNRLRKLTRSFLGFICCRHTKVQAPQEEQQETPKLSPRTKLLIVIVVVALFMASTVASVAIGISWGTSVQNKLSGLKKEVTLMKNAAEFFAFEQSRVRTEKNLFNVASILANMISQMGYSLSLTTTQDAQVVTVKAAASMVDQIFVVSNKNELGNAARVMASFIEQLYNRGYGAAVVDLLNSLNSDGLPADYEMLLAQLGSNDQVTFLTTLKFQSLCPGGVCGSDPRSAVAMRSALAGQSGSLIGPDYSSTTVIAGYAAMPSIKMGFVYKAKLSALQAMYQQQAASAVDVINSLLNGTTELMLLKADDHGQVMSLSGLKYGNLCGTHCDMGALQFAVNTTSGSLVTAGYRGSPIVASYTFLPYSNVTLLLKVNIEEFTDLLQQQLGTAGTKVSRALPGTKEMTLAVKVMNGTKPFFKLLTDVKYPTQCIGTCGTTGTTAAIIKAAVLCQGGYMTGLMDYRGKMTIAGYACSPELSIGVGFKEDDDEIMSESLDEAVQYANARNQNATDTTELIIGEAKTKRGVVRTAADLVCMTSNDNLASTPAVNQCPNDEAAAPMIKALSGQEGTDSADKDYNSNPVISAYTYSRPLAAGLVFKIDRSYLEKPLIVQLFILLGAALGIVLVGVLILGYSARTMLNSITDAWEKGQKAVEAQKRSFENLISALYPKFATERLLEGDKHIVLYVPEASIFFSDIYNFTITSNRINAEELVNWIGYAFRVMDEIAEWNHIYKIKTIGDSYFAISGLPNATSMDDEEAQEEIKGNSSNHQHALRMLTFASYVAQVFSERYDHPQAGACLDAVKAKTMVFTEQFRHGEGHSSKSSNHDRQKSSSSINSNDRKTSHASSSSGSTLTSVGSVGAQPINSRCAMRYGVALGPVTTGVLHGKCPAFDVWGNTVNLAHRMQTTSKACRIQCSEGIFKAVAELPNTPFLWEKPTITFAKGFGNITTYMLKGSHDTPPKELMVKLGLESQLGFFPFDVPNQKEYTEKRANAQAHNTQQNPAPQSNATNSNFSVSAADHDSKAASPMFTFDSPANSSLREKSMSTLGAKEISRDATGSSSAIFKGSSGVLQVTEVE